MNKKLVFSVMLVCLLAFSLVFVSCGNSASKLEGTWETESGDSNLELSKDGTGKWDGYSITWKIENKRLVFTGSGLTFSYSYQLSGSTLTVTDDDETTVFKRK